MGCRPSKHASSKIRAAEAMGGGFGSHFGSGKFTRRIRPGGLNFQPQVKNATSLQSGCHPSTEFSDFSTTTATYSSPGFKTSKITVRLSSDGSTLEIEKCEIEPEVVLQRSESAPALPTSPTEEQTTLHSFQQTVCADVVPVPYQFRTKDETNGIHSLPSSESHTRILPMESVNKQTIFLQAPKATVEELDDFAITIPKATLAVAEETTLLTSIPIENGSNDGSGDSCCKCREKADKNSQAIHSRNANQNEQLLAEVVENRPDYIGCQANCVSRSGRAEVLCVGSECNSTSCPCNKIDVKNSHTFSDEVSAISVESHFTTIENKLAFCSYTNTTDETWDRGISGLGILKDNNPCVNESLMGRNLSGIYPDDLSNQNDRPSRQSQINQEAHTVRATRLLKGDPVGNIKDKYNHSVNAKTENLTKNCSSDPSLGLNSDVMTATSANFYRHKRSRQGEKLIKDVTNELSLSVPTVSHYQNSLNENVNTLATKSSIMEESNEVSIPETEKTSRGVEMSLVPNVLQTDLPSACKESIPVTMESNPDSEEAPETDECDITYVHRGFINDFEDIFDETDYDDNPPSNPQYS